MLCLRKTKIIRNNLRAIILDFCLCFHRWVSSFGKVSVVTLKSKNNLVFCRI
uniref:Predicted protein n=1 Tax=Hordeum vulgare subsp. vulgare TaxID=112509 RepID=F2E4M0_HORVV|nr:predicted protein [Hordeum vulgare subsp. vulgare]